MSLRDQVVSAFSVHTAFAMFLKHAFPGCVFVHAVQTLDRGITHRIWQCRNT